MVLNHSTQLFPFKLSFVAVWNRNYHIKSECSVTVAPANHVTRAPRLHHHCGIIRICKIWKQAFILTFSLHAPFRLTVIFVIFISINARLFIRWLFNKTFIFFILNKWRVHTKNNTIWIDNIVSIEPNGSFRCVRWRTVHRVKSGKCCDRSCGASPKPKHNTKLNPKWTSLSLLFTLIRTGRKM